MSKRRRRCAWSADGSYVSCFLPCLPELPACSSPSSSSSSLGTFSPVTPTTSFVSSRLSPKKLRLSLPPKIVVLVVPISPRRLCRRVALKVMDLKLCSKGYIFFRQGIFFETCLGLTRVAMLESPRDTIEARRQRMKTSEETNFVELKTLRLMTTPLGSSQ